ncbi:hypothetical protein GQ53DRAFT_741717 [Thozetella sp. PMI_491]|nr:hypothetical protein GQ53DRAFT_741717 [Thozetella sp. PMI_491]
MAQGGNLDSAPYRRFFFAYAAVIILPSTPAMSRRSKTHTISLFPRCDPRLVQLVVPDALPPPHRRPSHTPSRFGQRSSAYMQGTRTQPTRLRHGTLGSTPKET